MDNLVSQRAVRLNDKFNTIIIINESADTEVTVKKYIKDLRECKQPELALARKNKEKSSK